MPPSVIGGQRYAFIRSDAAVLGPRFKFAKHGQCGAEIAEMLPHLAKIVDDICLIKLGAHRSVQPRPGADFLQHRLRPAGPAESRLVGAVRPRARDEDLPAFVVMSTGSGISGGAANWSSGFLPTVYTGVRLPQPGRSDPQRLAARRAWTPTLAARFARPGRRAQSSAARRRRRSGDRHAHRLLRDGLPPANVGAGADGPAQGKQGDARAVRRRSGQAVVRPRLPAGPADDRARRALREHLSRRLGRPFRCGRQPSRQLRGRPIRRRRRWCRI